jgi:NAD(P)-dependent dehydrogenase (short-subunit alcohol dehydrogenase family)
MQRTVLVSGATGYFGRYMVESLANKYHVIATSRSKEKLESFFGKTENVSVVALDLYDTDEIEASLDELGKSFDIIGLVNNAYDFSTATGFNTEDGNLENLKVKAMRKSLDSGLLAPLLFCQIIGKQMIEKKISGSIINISSMYGLVSPDSRLYEGKKILNPVTYGINKAGLNALTRYIASFWGPHGIRCNSIAPGPFPNLESNSANAPDDTEFVKRLENKTTLGRTGHPSDLLGLLHLLISEESSFITGQTIAVDGGWTSI